MMRFFLIAILFAVGCTQDNKQPESTPIATKAGGGGQIEMKVNPEGPKPVSRARLIELRPSLSELADDKVKLIAEAVNILPSPCAQCGSLPLAHCLERVGASECSVLSKLFDRAAHLANTGRSTREVKESINYPDVWFPGMGEGKPPRITVYQDESGPFNDKTMETIEALKAEFGDEVSWDIHGGSVVAPDNLEVRGRPTWFVNGHRFRGSQSLRIIRRYIALELSDVN